MKKQLNKKYALFVIKYANFSARKHEIIKEVSVKLRNEMLR